MLVDLLGTEAISKETLAGAESLNGVILTRIVFISIHPITIKIEGMVPNVEGTHISKWTLDTKKIQAPGICPRKDCCNIMRVRSGNLTSLIRHYEGDQRSRSHELKHHFDSWDVFKRYTEHAQIILKEAGCMSERDAICYNSVVHEELKQAYRSLENIISNERHLDEKDNIMKYPRSYRPRLLQRRLRNNIDYIRKWNAMVDKLQACDSNRECPK